MRYAVVEIAGRQYKVVPNQVLTVDNLGDIKTFECDKVLLLAGDSLSLGNPYLKDKLMFEVLESKREPKIRVATYKAKAKTRKVRGSRRSVSVIKLAMEDKQSTEKKVVKKSVKKDK